MRLQAYLMGLRDAYRQRGDLAWGMTWSNDQDANEVYDQGANAGEHIYRALRLIRAVPR